MTDGASALAGAVAKEGSTSMRLQAVCKALDLKTPIDNPSVEEIRTASAGFLLQSMQRPRGAN